MKLQNLLIPLVLWLVMALYIGPIFKGGYTANIGSLEPVTLTLAKRVAQEGIWGWYPNWYLGLPFRFLGPPASFWILGGFARLGVDILVAYRVFWAVSLISLPVGFYFLARRVHLQNDSGQMSNVTLRQVQGDTEQSRSINGQLSAFASGLFLILLPSTGYLLPKFFKVGQTFGFAPSWTFQELPRQMGLALLPIVLILYWRLLEKINFVRLLAAIGMSSVLFLTDGVTTFSLLLGVGVILIIEGSKEKFPISNFQFPISNFGHFLKKVVVVVLALGLALLLDAFYFTPRNLQTILTAPTISGIALGSFLKTLLNAFLGFGPAVIAVFWLKLSGKNQILSFIFLWLMPFLTITLLYWISNPDFVTEYSRFLPEVEIGVALLFGYSISRIVGSSRRVKISNFKWIGVRNKGQLIQFIVLIGLFYTLVYSFWNLPKRWNVFKLQPDITSTVEYQIAKWLETEVAAATHSTRVFLSGSTAFWLNEFAPDVWQVRGGIDHASTHPWWDHAAYQIRVGEEAELSLLWMRALRVNYFVVHDQISKEYYHDFVYPEKFEKICGSVIRRISDSVGQSISESVNQRIGETVNQKVGGSDSPIYRNTESANCQLVFDNGRGDRIYQLDWSLAQVVGKEGFKDLVVPKNGVDKQALGDYVGWLQSGISAQTVESNGDLIINFAVKKNQVVALGITYDGGWMAWDNFGNKPRIDRDSLGNLVIQPKVEGEQELRLSYHEGLDLWVGIAVSILTLGFLIFVLSKKFEMVLDKVGKGWGEEE